MNKFLLASSLISALILGCSPAQQPMESKSENTKTASDITVDISTPDRSVKSYWSVRNAIESEQDSLYKKAITDSKKTEYNKKYDKVMMGQTLKFFTDGSTKSDDILDREIVEVKQETESRAIVFARIKNVTPVPAGAIATKNDIKKREEGERFKYILEKTNAGWKVTQVYKYESYKSSWDAQYEFNAEPIFPMYVFRD